MRGTEVQTRRRRDLHGLTARYPVDEFPCLFLIGTHTFASALVCRSGATVRSGWERLDKHRMLICYRHARPRILLFLHFCIRFCIFLHRACF